MFTMEPKTGYEVAPIIGKLPNYYATQSIFRISWYIDLSIR